MNFIREHVQQKGTIRRSDITAKFGVSVPQASIDLRTMQEESPDLMHYDRRRGTYVLSTDKPPAPHKPNPRCILSLPPDLSDPIDRYRAAVGMATRNAAVTHLLREFFAKQEADRFAPWFDPSHPINK